jgi:class 3 adenylate cyclase
MSPRNLGDGLMSLFGYPVAHENDAERAVRAALAIQRALAGLNRNNAGSGKPVLAARIGLETGPAVVDATGEIYGDVANIAARVQALAGPDAVLVRRECSGRSPACLWRKSAARIRSRAYPSQRRCFA